MKKLNFFKAAAISALVSLVALTGCNNATTAAAGGNYSATGQIFGYVTDTKGEPLSGVTIALGNLTTTTNANGAFALTGVPANATQGSSGGITEATNTNNDKQKYVLTATKDGYLSSKLENIYVVETTDKSDSALLLNTAATAYKDILYKFAEQGGAGITTVSSNVATDGILMNTQNINETFKGMADAYATIIEKYQNLSKTYESTFVTTTLTPCNAYVEGSLKITKSPQKNITTDAASIKAAPADVKVKLVGGSGTTKYVYEAKTDSNGKFKFEKLPVNTELTLKVEGFEATYESGEGENKVVETYYYSLINGAGASASLWCGDELQENKNSFTLEENSGAKYKADILLYSQPAKIIATATNLLENSEVAPLALNTALTVSFNKPMDFVKLAAAATGADATVTDTEEKANYAWDDKKTTVTITPKDGYWTSNDSKTAFYIEGRAQDGARSFIDNKFTVWLDNVIKIVFADTSDATADKFTLTFDRELVKTDAVKVTDNPSEALDLSWDKTNAAAPVLTVKARDGKFANAGEHTFTITGVEAKDQSTKISSYSREFVAFTAATNTTPANATFKTRFDGFKATGIEVVDKAEGALSRAVVATTAQYLKITFNKNVEDVSGLTVGKLTTTGTTTNITAYTVEKFIKDNAVYISLANFSDKDAIGISGTVISKSGDKFDGTGDVKWNDLLTDYTVRTAYVIAASNLYVEKASINAGNDNTVTTIKKGDNVTLTFNKDIPTDAVIETEVYVYENNKLVKMDETGYKATYAAAGKVVTLTLSETKPGTTYYLSLKIKSKDGAVLFSTGSKSFATGTPVKDLYIEPSITHTFPATAPGATANAWDGKKYIKIEVASVKLLPEGSSKTTKAADFKKVSNGTIVLQFNQDVTGYKAFLYTRTAAARTALNKNYENLSNEDKAYFYGAKYEVSGDTITITPNASFSSADKPAIAVYNDEGDYVEFGTLNSTTNLYDYGYEAKSYTAKLEPANATKALEISANKSEAFVPASDTLKFSFDMPLNTYSNAVPTFTLYKKIDVGYGDKEWVKSTVTYQSAKEDGTTYTFADAKAKTKAWITVDAADAPNFTYGTTTEYVLLTTVNNMVIKSNEVTIKK